MADKQKKYDVSNNDSTKEAIQDVFEEVLDLARDTSDAKYYKLVFDLLIDRSKETSNSVESLKSVFKKFEKDYRKNQATPEEKDQE